MEFVNEKPPVRFTIPDEPTVRQQLAWQAANTSLRGGDNYLERAWRAAGALIDEWECEIVAPGDDLDEITNPKATQVIIFVVNETLAHMLALDEVPKN